MIVLLSIAFSFRISHSRRFFYCLCFATCMNDLIEALKSSNKVHTIRDTALKFQEISLKSFKDMADLIDKKSHDKATSTSLINDTAIIVGSGLVNVIMASSDSARLYGEYPSQDSQPYSNNTVEKVCRVDDVLHKSDTLMNQRTTHHNA